MLQRQISPLIPYSIKLNKFFSEDMILFLTVSVYSLVIFYLTSLVTATYYSYDRYYYLKNSGNPEAEYGVAPLFAGEFDYYLGLKKTWLAFGMFAGYFSPLFYCIRYFYENKMKLFSKLCPSLEDRFVQN